MTGAALRMTWHQFFVAGAVLYTGGVEKSQNALVRGCQLCNQLSNFEGSLAELIFDVVKFKIEEVPQNCFVLDVIKFENEIVSLAELQRFCC